MFSGFIVCVNQFTLISNENFYSFFIKLNTNFKTLIKVKLEIRGVYELDLTDFSQI